jgi:hypothetical protein
VTPHHLLQCFLERPITSCSVSREDP